MPFLELFFSGESVMVDFNESTVAPRRRRPLKKADLSKHKARGSARGGRTDEHSTNSEGESSRRPIEIVSPRRESRRKHAHSGKRRERSTPETQSIVIAAPSYFEEEVAKGLELAYEPHVVQAGFKRMLWNKQVCDVALAKYYASLSFSPGKEEKAIGATHLDDHIVIILAHPRGAAIAVFPERFFRRSKEAIKGTCNGLRMAHKESIAGGGSEPSEDSETTLLTILAPQRWYLIENGQRQQNPKSTEVTLHRIARIATMVSGGDIKNYRRLHWCMHPEDEAQEERSIFCYGSNDGPRIFFDGVLIRSRSASHVNSSVDKLFTCKICQPVEKIE